MKEKPKYNGVIILTDPVYINDVKGKTKFIYGILYNFCDKMYDNLFCWKCERYLSYLYAAQRSQYNKTILEPEVWIAPSGALIILDDSMKNYIHQYMRENLPVYRIVEMEMPFELKDNEYESCFLTSPEPLKRYHLIDYTDNENTSKNIKDSEPLTKYLNTFERYSKLDLSSDEIKIAFDHSCQLPKMTITLSESQKRFVDNVLFKDDRKINKTDVVWKYNQESEDRFIKSFDSFIKEQRGTPPNVQSYFGCLDDEEDLEEE